jgi:hypothetical protein
MNGCGLGIVNTFRECFYQMKKLTINVVTLSSTMRTGGFELASSALTSSTLKWLDRIQCGFKSTWSFDFSELSQSTPDQSK